jgi:acyl-CoA dehydrogenase
VSGNLFRETCAEFTRREIVPHIDEWERAGEVPRELHVSAAQAGLLGVDFPEAVGGQGGGFEASMTLTEELIQNGGSSGICAALLTHGIALPHIVAAGDAYQIDEYVRPTLAGERIGALAVTEPGGGSDVRGIRTTARRDGGDYVVDGTKTFITSGCRADFVTTAVRIGERVSLLVIDRDMGFTSQRLDKMGWLCSDTAEISFAGVRVPARNVVGEEGEGFAQIVRHFVSERLGMAVQGYATAQRCLDLSLTWARERHAFGEPLGAKQVIRHKLAEMARETDVAREYVRGVARRPADVPAAAMAKITATRAAERVAYDAVQIHGGLGYMRGVEVERHYRDARILAIGGGTTEILREIVAGSLDL